MFYKADKSKPIDIELMTVNKPLKQSKLKQYIDEHHEEAYAVADSNYSVQLDDEWREENEWNESCDMESERYCTIQESIIESCKQVNLMQEGKIPKRKWKDFIDVLKKEIAEIENN